MALTTWNPWERLLGLQCGRFACRHVAAVADEQRSTEVLFQRLNVAIQRDNLACFICLFIYLLLHLLLKYHNATHCKTADFLFEN